MVRTVCRRLPGLALLLACAFAPASRAADAPVLRSKSFEVGGFLGSSYGADDFRVMGGGNATYGLTKRILPYVEYSYFPGLTREIKGQLSDGSPYNERFSLPFSDFHGGIHYRIIIREKPIVPYLVVGAGVLKSFDTKVDLKYRDANGESTFNTTVPGQADFAVNFGGGVRYYATQRYGFRVEAKVYRSFSDLDRFNTFFSKVEAGFFIQLR